ncbi:MAG TPA: cyclic nucleotide-binding domain-containing protein [Ktedonobacteraceae bacterium]|jgi:CRP/FNR family cyclic AMP-dependent transcriptional regulator|nr:cyclic nucleotide-binding domain-containing protein [Ktedonobacteraceae bacterium]
MSTLEEALAEHPFFRGFDSDYLHDIVRFAVFIHYDSDVCIFHEGEQATHFYLLNQGKVGLETFSADRGAIAIETIEAGEVLGWSWLFPPYRWHFSSRVIEPVHGIMLDAATLRKMCDEDHTFGYELVRRIAHVITQRLQSTRLQLLDVYRLRTEEA